MNNPMFPLSYDLWREPWLRLQRADGTIERLGIEAALLRSNEFTAISESSPLAVCGIHRLLVAILQDALRPKFLSGIQKLLASGRMPAEPIRAFADEFGGRFDLFSPTAPFMQSADLPLAPAKGENVKPVAYLALEQPAGSAHTHYRHGADVDYRLCPACAAGGLCVIPAFATSGGAGIKPSINGVPPFYLIPGGSSLFHSLASSLLTPDYQPQQDKQVVDLPWWRREPLVPRSAEVLTVGYTASLTFPARRVRLHPEAMPVRCSRCGENYAISIRTMIFEMGESRPKDSPAWQDPFAAYRLPTKKSTRQQPSPVRPQEGRAAWREFSALFLRLDSTANNPRAAADERYTMRPHLIDQYAELYAEDDDAEPLSFRAVGMRTDMKAKIFEWVDAGFELPTALLRDNAAAGLVNAALACADECGGIIARVMAGAAARGKIERYRSLRERLSNAYWQALAEPFRRYVLRMANPAARVEVQSGWITLCSQTAFHLFEATIAQIGDDAEALRERVLYTDRCRILLNQVVHERSM